MSMSNTDKIRGRTLFHHNIVQGFKVDERRNLFTHECLYSYCRNLDFYRNIVLGPFGGCGTAATGIIVRDNTFDNRENWAANIVLNHGAEDDKPIGINIRNNIFCRPPQKGIKYHGAIVDQKEIPDAIAYGDYNCFFGSGKPFVAYHTVKMTGKTLRKDDGFGKNDLPVGGKPDEEVDPRLVNPDLKIEVADQDLLARKITVEEVMKPVWDAYGLRPDSPCIDAGAPDDPVPEGGGKRVDIGAVEFVGKNK